MKPTHRTILMTCLTIAGVTAINVADPMRVADVLLLVLTAVSWLFVILYGGRSQAFSNPEGKSIFYTHFALSALSTQVSLSLWLGLSYPGRDLFRPYLYLVLTLALVNMVLTLYHSQREQRIEADRVITSRLRAIRKEHDASPD